MDRQLRTVAVAKQMAPPFVPWLVPSVQQPRLLHLEDSLPGSNTRSHTCHQRQNHRRVQRRYCFETNEFFVCQRLLWVNQLSKMSFPYPFTTCGVSSRRMPHNTTRYVHIRLLFTAKKPYPECALLKLAYARQALPYFYSPIQMTNWKKMMQAVGLNFLQYAFWIIQLFLPQHRTQETLRLFALRINRNSAELRDTNDRIPD